MSEKDANDSGTEPQKKQKKSDIVYVPIEYLQSIQDNEDRIDIYELVKTVWNGRYLILKILAVFILIGLFMAFFSIEEYTSEAKLIPENQQSMSLGGLGGLARQFGVVQQQTSQGDNIAPNLYPDITASTIFLHRLLEATIALPNQNIEITILEYLRDHQKVPIGNYIRRYTTRLPFTIWNQINRESAEGNREISDPVYHEGGIIKLSPQQWAMLRTLRGRISTEIDRESRIVRVSVKMQDPDVAAEVTEKVVSLLSEYIIEYRTEKTRQNMAFIEDRFIEAKEQFEESQEELALFLDQNRGQLTAMAQTRQQLLQSRYDLTFNLYYAMAERLEDARIKLQEETPVLSIIEPPAVPDRPSEPNRRVIIIIYTFLGGMFGVAVVFALKIWESLKVKLDV